MDPASPSAGVEDPKASWVEIQHQPRPVRRSSADKTSSPHSSPGSTTLAASPFRVPSSAGDWTRTVNSAEGARQRETAEALPARPYRLPYPATSSSLPSQPAARRPAASPPMGRHGA